MLAGGWPVLPAVSTRALALVVPVPTTRSFYQVVPTGGCAIGAATQQHHLSLHFGTQKLLHCWQNWLPMKTLLRVDTCGQCGHCGVVGSWAAIGNSGCLLHSWILLQLHLATTHLMAYKIPECEKN